MILTEIGEIGAYFEGCELVLRPSLYAMTKLGSKKEIVDIFTRVMNGDIAYSLAVIQACCDEDTREIFGYIDHETLEFIEMYASPNEIMILAQSLMKHGIIGDIDRSDDAQTGKKDYTPEFDAKSYVSAVVAHLGISEREAWQMTMTSVAGALRAKYPPQPSPYMSEKREEELLEWFNKKDKK